ncbi:uncharacterized protein LOC125047447 [Penaeus chinensis]|uniref:uncharacterized protein LOC125047447 n=1 Tax=Penaeus chinensis TaxID=139456 RepID=UPI001FB7DECD|nr:uncharacterized protein LOC125047447 [Penaeus chinensis]
MRKELAKCFLESTSTLLLITNVSLLVLVYTVTVYGIRGGSAAVPVICTACFDFTLCDVGQDFEDKVETAIERLRDYKCKTTDTELLGFVESVQRSLEPQQRFSMCGWYNLNKTLLLALGNLVMTNLVVLLQIGNSNSMSS